MRPAMLAGTYGKKSDLAALFGTAAIRTLFCIILILPGVNSSTMTLEG